jgi:hypothetical protein
MREYAAVYDSRTGKSFIVAKDPNDTRWHVYLGDIPDIGKAEEIADSMNRAQHGEA